MCAIAAFTCPTPCLCSRLATVISAMMPVTFFTELSISPIVCTASSTSRLPVAIFSVEAPISSLISFAAPAARCGRYRVAQRTHHHTNQTSPEIQADRYPESDQAGDAGLHRRDGLCGKRCEAQRRQHGDEQAHADGNAHAQTQVAQLCRPAGTPRSCHRALPQRQSGRLALLELCIEFFSRLDLRACGLVRTDM